VRRRTLLSSGLAAGLGATGSGLRSSTAGAAYPSRMLTLIVPFQPGSSIGLNARLLQPYLERALGQPVQLQFNQGGGGLTGHLLGAEATPDGYTLTMVSSVLTVQSWLSRASVALPDNFAFVGQVTCLPSVLLARAGSPRRSLGDLVATLRTSPGSLTTGNMVNWWSPAIALTLFTTRAAIKPRVVTSYDSGAELAGAVLRGQLDFAVVGLEDVGPSMTNGALLALAVTSPTSTLPNIPTFQAQGFDVTAGSWRGLALPSDCPGHAIARLDTGLRQALSVPSLHADFAAHGISVDPLGAADFGRLVQDEYRTSGALLTSLGLNVRAQKHA
jgi:tripartite-type tricarboxylate transporter receptor subunit TctC